MMRVLHINCCSQCPNFDDEYYSYREKCRLLNRVIPQVPEWSCNHPIPEDCPLEKVEDEYEG